MTSPPWTPERVVDRALAQKLIGTQFPTLDGASVEPFGEGWDNTVYLVSSRWVFRFPRRQIAVPLIETEVRCLATLAQQLPLAVPRPEYIGQPTEEFPWPFLGYAILSGQTGDRANLTAAERHAAAPVLGRFVRALHNATLDRPPEDTLVRWDVGRRVPSFMPRLSALHEAGVVDDMAPFQRLLTPPWPQPTGPTGLCHGDLYCRHLLFEHGKLSGIIDWGDLNVGQIGVDLAVVYSFLPPRSRASFFSEYGAVDDESLRLARLRALLVAGMLADYGRQTGDKALCEEGRLALSFVVCDD